MTPLVILVMWFNIYLDTKVGKLFPKLLEGLDRLEPGAPTQTQFEDLWNLFLYASFILMAHYAVASLLDFLKSILSLSIYQTFLSQTTQQITNLEYSLFHNLGSSYLQETMVRSSKAARDSIPLLIFDLPDDFFNCTGYLILLYQALSAYYFKIFILLTSVSFFMAFWIGKFNYTRERKNLLLFNKTLSPLSDILSNFDIMKAFNKEKDELKNYQQELDPYVQSTTNFYRLKHFLFYFQKAFLFLPQAIMIYFLIKESPKRFLAKGFGCVRYNNIFSKFKSRVMSIRHNYFAIIKKSTEVSRNIEFGKVKKEIKFEKLNFIDAIKLKDAYLYAGNNLILKNANFELPKGYKFAITGTNGAGKTVFIKTLLKFFKNEGSLYFDDVLLSALSDSSARDLISYAPQDPHIFNNTVFYNLCYSCKTTPDPEVIYQICQSYGLHEFFKSMKDGYDTQAGERGKYLSGGQKQRISLMRAVIKNSPIMIMDEPTANIDRFSEMELVDKIFELNPEKTLLFIVHNYDLLKKFDKILYFTKDGVEIFNDYESFITKDDQPKISRPTSPDNTKSTLIHNE